MPPVKRTIELTDEQAEEVLYLLTNNRGWFNDDDKELAEQVIKTLDNLLSKIHQY